MHSIVLFAHGARDPEWARPLQRLREVVLMRSPEADVRLAFLEFMRPSLAEAVDACVHAGATRVDIVPVFLAQGGHVRRDVPLILQAARERHPELTLELRAALGEMPEVIEAMATCVLRGG
ncbi:CbiX/SirB N-terminal domain-containing protein [Uliginosibacterium sp. 31-16]|uniref:sirohydrochlorin chelatase n=1 Tax=Uliginosibacterium sp. 31-16 TaxID=3068315 RepID=UPI00273D9C7E|nr:CbiX/SirB N-terminal domain-containing protein [Uliginosibacterium sp. 31-16]MDP5238368.1 CbiX/SirB N-terminal domain-containing protein [Uliginosibacterium sp. 31-16]